MSGGKSSFFVAFRVLPNDRRRAIEAVYDFCRRADDAVDDAPDPVTARESLERMGDELDEVFAAARGPSAVSSALVEAVRKFRLPREPFEMLLEGVSWDLEGRTYSTAADLREYCRRVASSVGLLCVRIFGCTDPACDGYAEELGVALQWTNILRDLGSDLARGRVYLPDESFRRHGLARDDLLRRDPDRVRRVGELIRGEAAYARACYEAAERSLPVAERSRVLAGRIMGAVYATLLRKIERAGAGVLERRLSVSTPRRALLAAGLVIRDRLREAGAGG